MVRLFALLGLGGLLLATGAARGASGPEQLERFFQGLGTLSARFEQAIINPSQGDAGYAQGTLYLQRPGRFRWEYQIPDQLIVADGERVWMFDKELDQVSQWGQESALKGTPALLLSDTSPLQDNFEVIDVGHRNGYEWAELRPRYEDSEFSRILLAFSEDQLQRMEIADNFGQITRFRFTEIQRNPGLDPELFRFEPPSGIDLFSE
jgi:outer membrane lipoprotein carrier protein